MACLYGSSSKSPAENVCEKGTGICSSDISLFPFQKHYSTVQSSSAIRKSSTTSHLSWQITIIPKPEGDLGEDSLTEFTKPPILEDSKRQRWINCWHLRWLHPAKEKTHLSFWFNLRLWSRFEEDTKKLPKTPHGWMENQHMFDTFVHNKRYIDSTGFKWLVFRLCC